MSLWTIYFWLARRRNEIFIFIIVLHLYTCVYVCLCVYCNSCIYGWFAFYEPGCYFFVTFCLNYYVCNACYCIYVGCFVLLYCVCFSLSAIICLEVIAIRNICRFSFPSFLWIFCLNIKFKIVFASNVCLSTAASACVSAIQVCIYLPFCNFNFGFQPSSIFLYFFSCFILDLFLL